MSGHPHRPLAAIAADIAADWHPVYFAAEPYVRAMAQLDSIHDYYGADSAYTVVSYFLGNARLWRGAVARAVKAELREMLKDVA